MNINFLPGMVLNLIFLALIPQKFSGLMCHYLHFANEETGIEI